MANVVEVIHREGSIWLGGIRTHDECQALVDWAVGCRDMGRIEELPGTLAERRVHAPFLAGAPNTL
jgi:hypothetical protein